MKYLLLLISILAVISCSSKKQEENTYPGLIKTEKIPLSPELKESRKKDSGISETMKASIKLEAKREFEYGLIGRMHSNTNLFNEKVFPFISKDSLLKLRGMYHSYFGGWNDTIPIAKSVESIDQDMFWHSDSLNIEKLLERSRTYCYWQRIKKDNKNNFNLITSKIDDNGTSPGWSVTILNFKHSGREFLMTLKRLYEVKELFYLGNNNYLIFDFEVFGNSSQRYIYKSANILHFDYEETTVEKVKFNTAGELTPVAFETHFNDDMESQIYFNPATKILTSIYQSKSSKEFESDTIEISYAKLKYINHSFKLIDFKKEKQCYNIDQMLPCDSLSYLYE